MERKKKYHGGLFLFFATLCALLFINTFSYASTSVTKEYIKYSLEFFINSGEIKASNGNDYSSTYRPYLQNMNVDNSVDYIYNALSTFQSSKNIEILGNVNLCFNIRNASGTLEYNAIFSNSSAPSGLDNTLGFLYLRPNNIYGTQADNIYHLPFYISSNGTITTGQGSTITTLSSSFPSFADYSINSSLDVVYFNNIMFAGSPGGYFYYNGSYRPVIFQNNYGNYVPSQPLPPDNNSGDGLGNITNSSGENTGNINLQPIVDGLGNIQNQISGDTTKIIENQNNNTNTIVNTISGEVSKITNTLTDSADNTIDNTNISSGDIVDSLGFSLMENPYQNFWFTMTQGLSSCLTDSVRSIPVDWLGFNGYFNLDGLINYPSSLKTILTTVSTVAMVWWLVKWWKIIIDKLTSGNVEEVLEMNEEERHN